MKMKTKFCVALVLAAFWLTGCQYAPAPTDKKVNPSDLVGQWRYRSEADVDVDLTLHPDATFRQATRLNGKVITRQGWWSLGGSDLVLSRALALTNARKFTTDDLYLWIVDDSFSAKPFVIFGTDGWTGVGNDPDSGSPFERVS